MIKRKKRSIAGLLVLVIASFLLFTGCGSNEKEEEAEPRGLADGIYTVDVDTGSTMFHVNEMYDGKGTLTVENGTMTVHITLASKNIVNLYIGSSEDAQNDEANWLQPTTDAVTYDDGVTDDVYGFDLPVEALDEPFAVAIIGTKGNWYDHEVTVSNPQLSGEK